MHKIYTKTGDKGFTSLIGGKRISKADLQIEAYGTVDELIAYIALLRDQPIDEYTQSLLLIAENNLMTCAAILAVDSENPYKLDRKILDSDLSFLEGEIDKLNEKLPPLTSFVLPGGHPAVSLCHVARTVCRRAERCVVRLNEVHNIDNMIVMYLNRLSDYLFVLGRSLADFFHIKENYWK